MRVFGMDIGFLVLIVEAVTMFIALSVGEWQEKRGSNEKLEKASTVVLVFSAIVFAVSLILVSFFDIGNKVETTSEKGWELSETHDLASLASFDGDGRMLEGNVSGGVWAMLGAGGGSMGGQLSSPADAGVYLLVERLDDGGLRKLAIEADRAIIYETGEADCRAELWSPVWTRTETLVEASWWFPSTADKYADGPEVSVERSTRAAEWRVYVPAGSVAAGSWDAGIGLDADEQK